MCHDLTDRQDRAHHRLHRRRGGATEFLAADLVSLAEVRRLGEIVRQRTERLDILINNAGTSRQTSADGHELRFAVNYLAGFLLTHLLLPLLQQSAPARILNVASAGQQPIDFADVMLTRGYSRHARLLPEQAGADHVHHRSRWGTRRHRRGRQRAASGDAHGHRDGAARRGYAQEQRRGRRVAILHLAVSPAVEGRSGRYFSGLREARRRAGLRPDSAAAAPDAQSGALRGLWCSSRQSWLTASGRRGDFGAIRAVSAQSRRSAARLGMRCARQA
jgi:NAD(P)-dependent dehydrogenase (short-subunit alcohol dehydrogenase family)